jgi:hypothetical protein
MRKPGLIVCKWRPCLPRGLTNSTQMCTIMTAALQRQYLQTEFILWIPLILGITSQKSVILLLSTMRIKHILCLEPSKFPEAVILLISVGGVWFRSHPGHWWFWPRCSWFSSVPSDKSGKYFKLQHDNFFPHPFQFIAHYHLIIWCYMQHHS